MFEIIRHPSIPDQATQHAHVQTKYRDNPPDKSGPRFSSPDALMQASALQRTGLYGGTEPIGRAGADGPQTDAPRRGSHTGSLRTKPGAHVIHWSYALAIAIISLVTGGILVGAIDQANTRKANERQAILRAQLIHAQIANSRLAGALSSATAA